MFVPRPDPPELESLSLECPVQHHGPLLAADRIVGAVAQRFGGAAVGDVRPLDRSDVPGVDAAGINIGEHAAPAGSEIERPGQERRHLCSRGVILAAESERLGGATQGHALPSHRGHRAGDGRVGRHVGDRDRLAGLEIESIGEPQGGLPAQQVAVAGLSRAVGAGQDAGPLQGPDRLVGGRPRRGWGPGGCEDRREGRRGHESRQELSCRHAQSSPRRLDHFAQFGFLETRRHARRELRALQAALISSMMGAQRSLSRTPA